MIESSLTGRIKTDLLMLRSKIRYAAAADKAAVELLECVEAFLCCEQGANNLTKQDVRNAVDDLIAEVYALWESEQDNG